MSSNKPKIALIHFNGVISDNKSVETTIHALNEAGNNEHVKVVVLRLNSPGGDVISSFALQSAINSVKQRNKKVIILTSNVLASGGYLAACSADKIIAQNSSIVGSIGVFIFKPIISDLLQKLKINIDTIELNKHTNQNLHSLLHHWNDTEVAIVEKQAKQVYQNFKDTVSFNRKHLISNIDELAQGKIYTGKQAKELKLIDDIGGYDKAFEIAKTYINEKDDQIEIIHYPAEIESFADLLKQSKMKETDNRYDFFKRFQSQSTSVYKNVFNTQQNSLMNQIYQFFLIKILILLGLILPMMYLK